jgi:hypothetical protein
MGLTVVIYKSLLLFSILAVVVIISSYISYKIKNRRKENRKPALSYAPVSESPVEHKNSLHKQNNYIRENHNHHPEDVSRKEPLYTEPYHHRKVETGSYDTERAGFNQPSRRRSRIPKERVKVLVPETSFPKNVDVGISNSAVSIESRKYLDMIQFYSDDKF